MNVTAAATLQTRFARRTSLTAGESRCNFRQVDNDALRVVRSSQARKVTNLMMHIYISLVDAPFKFRNKEGELYFAGEARDGKHITAWEQLTELLEVADGTALKALRWMHEQGVIGYCARKNGAGIRIFINRAVSSIRQAAPAQKNLPSTLISNGEARVSPNAMPFKEEARKKEDTKIKTFALQNRADILPTIESSSKETSDEPDTSHRSESNTPLIAQAAQPVHANLVGHPLPAHVIGQLRSELRSELRTLAAQAAASEAERTRAWLDSYGLPKAARVAQREAYNVFRHQSGKQQEAERVRAGLQVGRSVVTYSLQEVQTCSSAEISEMAEACVTMLEVQGKAIEETLAEISAAAGGWVGTEDVQRISKAAHALIRTRRKVE